MAENMYSPGQKTTSEKYINNYDNIKWDTDKEKEKKDKK